MRDPVAHAPAAFLASLSATTRLCRTIYRDFDPADVCGGLLRQRTKARFHASVLDGAATNLDNTRVSQRELSGMVDAKIRRSLTVDAESSSAFLSHFALCCLPGAAAWLTTCPAKDGRSIDGPLFVVALRRRLRIHIFDSETACPCCGDILDVWGDHCLTCSCAGNRVVRHNSVRDVVYEDSRDAGLQAEREKAGLLPPRASEEGLPPSQNARRPADVWQPRGVSGGAEAWDFSIGSGLTNQHLFRSARCPEEVIGIMEQRKRSHLDTESTCVASGFKFSPMIIEAHGCGMSSSL